MKKKDMKFTIVKVEDDIANRDAMVLHEGRDIGSSCLTNVNVDRQCGEITTVTLTYIANEVFEKRVDADEFARMKEEYRTRFEEVWETDVFGIELGKTER